MISLIVKTRRVSCDVLVIGCGSAGLRAAIEAHDLGADVLILSKSKKGDPHTVLATGGINAALGTMDPKDSWQLHAADTIRDGRMINDSGKVEILCRDGPRAVKELVKWGARFHREKDGRITQRFFGAATYRRACFYGDYTGREMTRVLTEQAVKRKIKFIDGVYVTKILKRGKEAVGALGVDFSRKEAVVVGCGCIVLAGGGYSRVYSVSSSRLDENYGEGVKLALDAGAELIDMEMVQFHPTGMVWPKKAVGVLVTEAVRGEGGILYNARHERFMKNYDPERMELGPRDEVARANYSEILHGRGTRHGGVLLDISHLPKEKILSRLPRMYKQFKEMVGIDISRSPMEVSPTAHYSMGGVRVDRLGRTGIPGLLAVGEVTGQLHGGNRLGGNSLLETVVFGKIVGKEAARLAESRKNARVDIDDVGRELPPVMNGAMKARARIQELSWKSIGIVRDGDGLRKALAGLKKIRAECERKATKPRIGEGMEATFQVMSILDAAECIARSALERKESRGAHTRSDFPKEDERWLLNVCCRKSAGGISVSKRKLAPLSPAMKKLVGRPKPKNHLLE
ncbi:MAG: FAD-binding protein [Candidatus Aenigmarchaeota archaeon]|nr:FAD-binding protein [Candidatus Aenigmarchaeota archaeon]